MSEIAGGPRERKPRGASPATDASLGIPVSVALCTYQGARFAAEQGRSIRAQSRPVAEVVIADDQSTDSTPEILAAELGNALVVTFLPGVERLGVTANFARAVSACTSPLIALCDQDDRWHTDKIARTVPLLEHPDGPVLVHTDARLIDETGRALPGSLLSNLEPTPEELDELASDRAFDAYLRRNLATGATILFRRELLEVALPFPAEWVHDEWLAVIAAATRGVRFLPETTIDYRQHGANEIGAARPTLRHKVARVLGGSRERNAELARRFAVLVERLEQIGEVGRDGGAAGAGGSGGAGGADAGAGSAGGGSEGGLARPGTARHGVPDDRSGSWSVRAGYLARAREKAEFEAARAALPRWRIARVAGIRRLNARGLYARYASRGRADMLRDLFQHG